MRSFATLTLAVCSLAPIQMIGQTLTLNEALDIAEKQNPTVQLARLRELERRQDAKTTESAYKPQANIVVSSSYQTTNLQGIGISFPGVPARVGPYRLFNARPVVTQNVLDFSLVSSIRTARLETAAAKLDIEAAREEIQAAVIALYLQTFEAQSRLRAAQSRVALAEALLKQVQDREEGGSASQLDVARNQQQRQTEELSAIAAQQELELLKPALAELLGGPIARELAVPTLREITATGIRPDVQAAETRVSVARQEVDRARRQRWPRLTAQGDWGVLGTGPEQSVSTYFVGGTLTIPIFTGGRIEAETEAARLRVQQREEETRRLRLAAQRQTDQARIVYQQQMRAATVAGESATAARKVFELAQLRYESGLATSVDTVTAQSALAQAEESEISARYSAQIALARLAFAQGDVRAAVQ